MDENKYIHIIDTDGKRITSIVIDILTTREKALEQERWIKEQKEKEIENIKSRLHSISTDKFKFEERLKQLTGED